MARGKKAEKKTAKNGANLGFEQTLWQAADKQAATGKLLDDAMLAIERKISRLWRI